MRHLLQPAVWLVNKLTYPKKFLLISILFLATLVDPMWELTKVVNTNIAFSEKERIGLAYIRPGLTLVEALIQQRRGEQPSLASAWEKLQAAQQQWGPQLDAAKPYAALSNTMDSLLAQGQSPSLRSVQSAIEALLALIDHVGFQSNLILDPDIDSYSLMDTVVIQMPRLLTHLDEASRHGLAMAQKKALSQAELIQLTRLLTKAQSRFEMTQGDMAFATQYTAHPRLKETLASHFTDYETTLQALIATLEGLLAQPPKGASPATLTQLGNDALTKAKTLADAEWALMDTLIQQRISKNPPILIMAYGVLAGLLCAIAYLLLGFYTAVIESIRQVELGTRCMAAGDLSTRIHLETRDEMGQVATLFNSLAASFSTLIGKVQAQCHAVTGAASQLIGTASVLKDAAQHMNLVADSTQELNNALDSNVKTVAAAVEQSSANIMEIFGVSRAIDSTNSEVGNAAQQASQQVRMIAQHSEQMTGALQGVVRAIEELKASLSEVAQNASQAATVSHQAEEAAGASQSIISDLSRATDKIGSVVDLIKTIAEQTNLLALNATIEAASAGEAGKGFAVVANEVKALARQSADATSDIQTSIVQMQTAAQHANRTITQIVHTISQINTINQTIAASVEEQHSAVADISQHAAEVAGKSRHISGNVQVASLETDEVSVKIHDSVQSVQRISRNLEEMTLGINEISKNATEAASKASDMSQNVDQVEQSVQRTLAASDEIQLTADHLVRMSGELEASINQFRLAKTP